MQERDKSCVVQAAFEEILRGNNSQAAAIIRDDYSFTPLSVERKGFPPYRATEVFFRDGFIDRYSGKRLVFPPVLKIISNALPTDFPYHPHWKMDRCHVAYWELYPTVDHVVPLARGGSDDETNLVCTSMLSIYAEQRRKSQLEVGGVGLATISSRRHPTVGRAREVVLRIYRRIPRGAGGPAHKTLVYSSYAHRYLNRHLAFSLSENISSRQLGE